MYFEYTIYPRSPRFPCDCMVGFYAFNDATDKHTLFGSPMIPAREFAKIIEGHRQETEFLQEWEKVMNLSEKR